MNLVEVYSAESVTEAHLIKGLLEQHQVPAEINGQYLQGGFGELPVINMIKVMVDEDDVSRARYVIDNYEKGVYALDNDD